MFCSKVNLFNIFPPLTSCLLLVALLCSPPLMSQSITGLWGVDKVQVGSKNVTPVAKWFRINEDGTGQAGNGWLQNWQGSWTYDPETKLYQPEGKDELIDEFGPFKVTFSPGKMTWERQEDGMPVIVSLSSIEEIPMSPADRIKGLWDLESVKKDGADITHSVDPSDKMSFFIRWDRLFNLTGPDGQKRSGFWHMDAHEPKFFLVDFEKSVEDQVFEVSFEGNKLVMKKEGEEEIVYTCRRLLKFPE
jgi:hypothetical protein